MWANFIFASSAAFFASFGLKKTWGTEKQSHDFDVQGTVIAIPNKIKDIKNLKLCCNIQCALEPLVQLHVPMGKFGNH